MSNKKTTDKIESAGFEVIKAPVNVNAAVEKQLTADGRVSKLETFDGIPPRFEEGVEYTLTVDPNHVVFGRAPEKEGDPDYRHVRLTAVGHSHETFSIPLTYFTKTFYFRDPARAAFRRSDKNRAILLGGTAAHKLAIPGRLNEKKLIDWLTGRKIIIPKGRGNIDYFALDFNTEWSDDIESLRALLGLKGIYEVHPA